MKDLNDIRMIFKELSELKAVPGARTNDGLVILRQGIPSRIDLGKVKSRYAQPFCIAARTIYELCDEVEKLESELKHVHAVHDDAERKLLKKIANARPKQSNTAGKTDERP